MKLLVLLLLPCLSLSELAPGFGDCKQYFLNKHPPKFTPQLQSAKQICQCVWGDKNQKNSLYATLYNTDWKIPIYSAYVFRRSISVGRCNYWYIEPQLDEANAEACMAPEGNIQNIGDNQAVKSDYEDQDPKKYDRGHLYPVQHTDNPLSMLATFTLTNAAPQDATFNQGAWRVHEGKVIDDLKECNSNAEAYVVTGVVPDNNIILKDRVTVSKYYWRATCCVKNNAFIGQGYFGPDNNNVVEKLSITVLQTRLAKYYSVNNIEIFPGVPKPSGYKRPRVEGGCY